MNAGVFSVSKLTYRVPNGFTCHEKACNAKPPRLLADSDRPFSGDDTAISSDHCQRRTGKVPGSSAKAFRSAWTMACAACGGAATVRLLWHVRGSSQVAPAVERPVTPLK